MATILCRDPRYARFRVVGCNLQPNGHQRHQDEIRRSGGHSGAPERGNPKNTIRPDRGGDEQLTALCGL